MRQLRRLTVLGLVVIALTHPHIPDVLGAQSKRRPQTAQQIAARATPSVVVLFNVDGNRQVRALGSGFFVANGLVVTNLHVIKGATSIYGRVVGTEGASKVIEVVITDEDVDLAVLRFDSLTGPGLPLATGLPQVGETVYAIGSPKGLEGTFTQGIVSAIRREDGLIQTQVPISPGSSGGPLLNARGEVVGVAVSTNPDGQNLNFVIPISRVRQMLAVAAAVPDPPNGGPALVPLAPPDNRWLSGDYSASKEAAKEREEANRQKAADLIAIGDDLSETDPDSALRALREALQLEPRSAKAYYLVGVIHANKQDRKNARAALQECVAIDPKHALAWVVLGGINYLEDAYSSAEICAKRAIEQSPSLASAHVLLGDARRAMGRSKDALESYQQAIRLNGHYVRPYCGMARIYRFAYSRPDLAGEVLREAFLECDGAEGSYWFLGMEAAAIGERTVALICYERLKELDSALAPSLWDELY